MTTIGMHYDVVPGKEAEFVQGFLKVLEHLKTLTGHVESHMYEDVACAGSYVILSQWETKESFDDEESETLLRGFLSGELYRRGLICRADDRGDPVIQLSPPLIAGPQQFQEISAVLRPLLTEAAERMRLAGS